MSKYTVVSFYTPNSPYEQEIAHLKKSCRKWKIPFDIEPRDSLGSWEQNVAMKPRFLLEKLRLHKHSIIWVDADASFLQAPDFTPFLSADIAVRFMEIFADRPEFAVASGTVVVNPTEKAELFLEAWTAKCEALIADSPPPPFADQLSLYQTLQGYPIEVTALPVSYCKIFDLDAFFINDDQVIIEHRQLSRLVAKLPKGF